MYFLFCFEQKILSKLHKNVSISETWDTRNFLRKITWLFLEGLSSWYFSLMNPSLPWFPFQAPITVKNKSTEVCFVMIWWRVKWTSWGYRRDSWCSHSHTGEWSHSEHLSSWQSGLQSEKILDKIYISMCVTLYLYCKIWEPIHSDFRRLVKFVCRLCLMLSLFIFNLFYYHADCR